MRNEKKRFIFAGSLCVLGVVAFLLLTGWAIEALKPDCPPQSTPTYTRAGWYCTVPAL